MRPVPDSCKDRKWLAVGKQLAAAPKHTFTVMSYNVLCQKLVKRTMFPYASKSSLKWKTRRPRLLDELSHLKPDIMCLQEVYTKNWGDTFDFWFKREGYGAQMFQSVYKSHGVSISWSKERFEAVDQVCLRMDKTTEVCGEALETDNIALIVVLRLIDERAVAGPSDGAQGIIVSNTHLYWKPSGCYERLQQQIVLQRALSAVQLKFPDYAVISCGDYNTTPDDAGYALLTTPRPVRLNDWQLDNLLPQTVASDDVGSETNDDNDDDTDSAKPAPMSYSEMAAAGTGAESEESVCKRRRLEAEERKADEQLQRDTGRVERLVSTMQAEGQVLESCYATYANVDPAYRTEQWLGEPIYTNYSLWKGTLDYIFYSPNRGLSVREVMSLPSEARLKPGIPNDTFASDHVSLVARFDLDK
ncbi:RNA exonuclease ngl2 [Coemansia erecta]|nr:RNA exonuclease ngl2 [Coemansia sp. RSA 2618]KAJ2822535.1 RNA exonuclease ngl2 [Coemansia erecta]